MWSLKYNEYNPEQQGLREALTTLGNGYFATRGAAEESNANDIHYPGTYLAGGFNRLKTEISGRMVENEDLVNFPNWLSLSFRIEEGEWFNLDSVRIIDYQQELNIKEGLMLRTVRFEDSEKRITKLTSRRFVHMQFHHVAGIEQTIIPENWSGKIEIRSAIDGQVVNYGVPRYRELRGDHLQPVDTGQAMRCNDIIWLQTETKQSRIAMTVAARTRVIISSDNDRARLKDDSSRTSTSVDKNYTYPVPDDQLPKDFERKLMVEKDYIAHMIAGPIEKGQKIHIEKICTIYTSKDKAISEPRSDAILMAEYAEDFQTLLKSHCQSWKYYWRRADLRFEEGNSVSQLYLRLHIFHILQTVSLVTADLDFSVPARGLHGEAYRGHIFWDEMFIFPFLNYRVPEITRSLLLYRYRRLPMARVAARKEGLKGALFPWQSGSNGREETQELHLNPLSGKWDPDHTHLQRHVNAAIVYNIWHYFQTTGDRQFLCTYGAEMIFEIAFLWESLTSYNEKLGRYEIEKVIGPDEYHEKYPESEDPGLDNNTYTNIMAVWCLRIALKTIHILDPHCKERVMDRFQLTEENLDQWSEITKKMHIVFHEDGILSQFEGYEKLKDLDWDTYRKKYGNLHRLDRILKAENDSPNHYKISKQADVLMLFYLFTASELIEIFTDLGYEFNEESMQNNINYYLGRTDHGSTLSRVVHSWVMARSNRAESWSLFREALESDVEDIQGGTTKEGIHLGAMAGTVDLVTQCYTGLSIVDNTLWFDPALPETISHLEMPLRYRNNVLHISINQKEMTINTGQEWTDGIKIGYRDQIYALHAEDTVIIPFEP